MKLEPKELRKFIADSEIEAMSKIEILSLTDAELALMVDSVINQSVNALVNTANALNGLFGNQNKQGFAMTEKQILLIICIADIVGLITVFIGIDYLIKNGICN